MEELIQKFIDNTISKEELDLLKKWSSEPENNALLQKYTKDEYNLNLALQDVDLDLSLESVLQKINNEEKPTKRIWPNVLKYAAVALLFVSATYGAYMFGLFNTEEDLKNEITLELNDGTIKPLNISEKIFFNVAKDKSKVQQEYTKLVYENNEQEGEALVYNKLSVPYGERFQVLLSDGTSVFLNAGSSLKYPVAFNDPKSRKVYLSGEAYFSVAKNKQKPFFVESENINVSVLGTKFNMSTYANENNNSVVLQEGSVKVKTNNTLVKDSLLLVPGKQVKLVDDKLLTEDVNVNKHIAWVDGSLLFINDKFQNIILELERHYNVTIINKNNALNSIRYTASFKKGEALDNILELFKENTNFEFIIKNNVVTINEHRMK